MSNFLTYIIDDVEFKKNNIKNLPNKTKTQQKKLKEIISTYKKKYTEYQTNIEKYIELKSKSIPLNDIPIESKENLESMQTRIKELKHLAKLLNPVTTYFEKIGADNLLFKLKFYNNFDFVAVNEILKELSDKFNMINLKLNEKKFKVTPYVNEYMKEFFIEANREKPNFYSLEKTFEKTYWVCPNIINHLELNFRILFESYNHDFDRAIRIQQDDYKKQYGIHSYEECMRELKKVHYQYTYSRKESLQDIIDLAIKGEIDVNEYFDDSKTRLAAYNMLVIQDKERNYDADYANNHENLKKLRNVLIEYRQYEHFIPFVEYNKKLFTEFKLPRPYKEIIDGKQKLETGIGIINKIIFDELSPVEKIVLKFKKKELLEKSKKQLTVDVTNYADKLLQVYQGLDAIKFYRVIKSIVTDYVTLDDFLNAFRDFEYFKKKEMQDTFEIKTYSELMEHIEAFDEFCNNPNNLVIPSVPVFQEYDVTKVIVDKYRINNFNLTKESVTPSNIDTLLSYIDLFLRSTHIMACNLTIQQVWFIVEAHKILNKPKENNQ